MDQVPGKAVIIVDDEDHLRAIGEESRAAKGVLGEASGNAGPRVGEGQPIAGLLCCVEPDGLGQWRVNETAARRTSAVSHPSRFPKQRGPTSSTKVARLQAGLGER